MEEGAVSDTAERVDASGRSAYARRVHTYWGVAWFCGIAVLLTGVVVEILVNRQLLPPSLHDTAIREGLLAVSGGCISLAIWLQTDYERISGKVLVGHRAANQRVYMLLSVVRRFITIILLAVPAIALILVLTHRVTGAAYDQATAVITLSSVANFGWVTVGFIRWLLQQEKKVRH